MAEFGNIPGRSNVHVQRGFPFRSSLIFPDGADMPTSVEFRFPDSGAAWPATIVGNVASWDVPASEVDERAYKEPVDLVYDGEIQWEKGALVPDSVSGINGQRSVLVMPTGEGRQVIVSPAKPGAPGASNYEVWLAEGNTGTEADFLETQKGPQGAPGGSDTETALRIGGGVATKAALAKSAGVVLSGPGIDPTGVTDSTAALRQKFVDGIAAGQRKFVGLDGATYKINIPEQGTLAEFINTAGVTVDMSTCTLDNTAANYTTNYFTDLFRLDGATDTTILVRRYIGRELTNIADLSYRGVNFVRAIRGCRGVTVKARLENARYGVQSGDYSDPSLGGCSGFDIQLTGTMIGYPIALYLADRIRHDIDVDGMHRAVYVAGCNDVQGTALWRDLYEVDTAYLITDCLTGGSDTAAQADPVGSPTTSRGCSNVDIASIDKGSTQYAPTTVCAGIHISRVDPLTYRNINIRAYTGSPIPGVSTKVALFRIASGAKNIWSRYAWNFEPSIIIDGVTVSGVMDHSAQTGEGNNPISISAYDSNGTHAAKLSGVSFDGVVVKAPSGNTLPARVFAPGLAGPAEFRGCDFGPTEVMMYTNASVETLFDNCKIGKLSIPGSFSRVSLRGSTVGSIVSAWPVSSADSIVGGAGAIIKQREIVLTPATAATWAAGLPAGALVMAVQGRVQSALTGATGFQVGVSGDLTRYADTSTASTGTTFGAGSTTETAPRYYPASPTLVVTAKGGSFAGGSLRLVVTYIEFSTPTA
jgi:hypothetical protein